MWPACASPAKPGEIVLPAIWPSRPIAISPDGNRNSPTLMQGPYAAMRRISVSTTCFLRAAPLVSAMRLISTIPPTRGGRLGRHNRYRARDVGVVLVPRVETIGRILDIGEVYLGLQRLLQRQDEVTLTAAARNGRYAVAS